MKKYFVLLLIFAVFSCDDDDSSSSNPCDPNPCTYTGKTVCSDNAGVAQCSCESGTTEDAINPQVCCGQNMLALQTDPLEDTWACECIEGYIEENGECILDTANPCNPNPCSEGEHGLHMTNCLVDGDSFICTCEDGFQGTDWCDVSVVETCPGESECLGNVCVSEIGQCVGDIDCNEGDASNPTICNFHVAGGICTGCRQGFDDCPTPYICNEWGSCSKPCTSPTDCPYGSCSEDGLCVLDYCNFDSDCPENTVCIDENMDGNGLCMRIPCIETTCSIYNPDGSCDGNSVCINGQCFSDCDPNPCTEGDHTRCDDSSGTPVCLCEEGYSEDINGVCVPDVCPSGFTCTSGYCVDPSEYFQCVTDSDCGGSLTCNPQLPVGTCSGCTSETDCPAYADTCLAGYCLTSCSGPADCADGMTCLGSGYCGKKTCSSNSECEPGYFCDTATSDSRCERIPCN
ncbi:hypothetical protein KKF34_15720 [Myxococcota bacterium]|nr:hypothetical protein [Myxococcota bacterium]MBU1382212.1 hypothetical protein [Myxococcota bacterium]MBU1498324.1 hypothetical protein [Myxococcota bacterium]